MLQLLQRFKLSALLLFVGIGFLSFGIYRLTINEPNPQPLKIHSADNKEQYQNIKNSNEIQQNISESATPSAIIMVDVSGAVVNPGVYELPLNARISQALELAGGITKKGDLSWIAKNLNQATKLNDGDKIFIPSIGEIKPLIFNEPTSTVVPSLQPQVAGVSIDQPGLQKAITTPAAQSSATPSPANGKININSATASELDVLPGIGPVTAQKIIDNRPYQTLEELKEKKAVNKSTYEKIKDKVKL